MLHDIISGMGGISNITSPVQTMNRNSGTTLEKDHSNEDQLYGKCRSWVVLSVQAAIILP